MRLGILASHPVQYQAPWFRALAKEVDLEVFFAHRPDANQQGQGFGKSFDWDVDLLSGYRHQFLTNVSRHHGSHHFGGCDTPEIANIIAGTTDDGRRTTGSGAIISGKQPSGVAETSLHGAGKAESRRQPNGIGVTISPAKEVGGQSSVVLQRFDAFIVSGWNLKCYWQAVRACRRAGIPVLVRGDSQLLTPRSRLKRWIKEIIYRLMLRQFDGFLVVGQRNREYLAHYGVPSEKMFFAPHFVDNEWFAARAAEVRSQKSEIRRKWGVPEDAFCVLFCGKFIPQKCPLDLVEAARLLMTPNSQLLTSNSLPSKIHLLFVGSGELGAQLRSKCNVVFDAEISGSPLRSDRGEGQGEVSNQVPTSDRSPSRSLRAGGRPPTSAPKPPASFAGFLNQTELPTAYVAADVLVLPSESETWGLAINEAMACGLPAIVSDAVGCAPDLIDVGKTGFTYPAGDCEQLARRIALIIEQKKQERYFGLSLHKKMCEFSLDEAVQGTLMALRKLSIL
jgi:glycosyltransferase involved in cell wall biosynthesis